MSVAAREEIKMNHGINDFLLLPGVLFTSSAPVSKAFFWRTLILEISRESLRPRALLSFYMLNCEFERLFGASAEVIF